ncbi:MAG: alpha/beta hydrolase, partial [Myxococcota bacterium]
ALKVAAGRLAAKLYPKLSVPSGIPPEVVSRDPEIVASYDRDPLVFKTATVGYVTEQEKTAARIKSMTHVPAPLLFIRSDADPLVSPSANERFSEQLESADKTVWLREGAKHEVLNEIDRHELHHDIARWILERID